MKVHLTLFSGHPLGCSSFCFGSAPSDYRNDDQVMLKLDYRNGWTVS